MALASLRSSREATRRILHDLGPGSAVLRNAKKNSEVFLVGVSHVSESSANLVQKVIRDVHPDVVAVELCEARSKSAILSNAPCEKYTLREFLMIPGGLKQKVINYAVVNSYVALASKGIKPGAELRTAVHEAGTIGARIALIDRSAETTLQRFAEELTFKDICNFFYDNKRIRIEHRKLLLTLKEARRGNFDPMNMLDLAEEVIQLFRKYFPKAVESLVDERNEHMVKQLRQIDGTVVGVVGALHVQGMKTIWEDAENAQ